ncbi:MULTISPECIES: hypothetical protein [unclassified Nocardiopsis]|uniref:hypothetical protein n=1 Tax=Nocardiopsis TaxID=2013 RepID=UPI00387AD88C
MGEGGGDGAGAGGVAQVLAERRHRAAAVVGRLQDGGAGDLLGAGSSGVPVLGREFEAALEVQVLRVALDHLQRPARLLEQREPAGGGDQARPVGEQQPGRQVGGPGGEQVPGQVGAQYRPQHQRQDDQFHRAGERGAVGAAQRFQAGPERTPGPVDDLRPGAEAFVGDLRHATTIPGARTPVPHRTWDR